MVICRTQLFCPPRLPSPWPSRAEGDFAKPGQLGESIWPRTSPHPHPRPLSRRAGEGVDCSGWWIVVDGGFSWCLGVLERVVVGIVRGLGRVVVFGLGWWLKESF